MQACAESARMLNPARRLLRRGGIKKEKFAISDGAAEPAQTAKTAQAEKTDNPDGTDKTENTEGIEKTDKPAGTEATEKTENTEGTDRKEASHYAGNAAEFFGGVGRPPD